MILHLTNHEALHGWALLNERLGRQLTDSPALQSAEEKLFAAYDERTFTATTVELTADECAAVADAFDLVLKQARQLGHSSKATPHLESMRGKVAALQPHPPA